MNEKCTHAVVNCTFKYAGCEVRLPRKDMPSHMADNVGDHLRLLGDHNQKLTEKNSVLIERLKNELEQKVKMMVWLVIIASVVIIASALVIFLATLATDSDDTSSRGQCCSIESSITSLERQWYHAIESNITSLQEQYHAIESNITSLQGQWQWQWQASLVPFTTSLYFFEQHKIDSDHWYSPPFYTHPQGYKMRLNVDANGYGDRKGTHISVFAHLMRGEFDDHLKWPFQGHVTVAILNQLEDNNHTTKTIRFTDTTDNRIIGRVTEGERAPTGFGYSTFIAHTELHYNPTKNCQYLKNNSLQFKVVKVELK